MSRALAFAIMVLGVACTSAGATPPTYTDLAYAPHWRQRIDLYIPQDRPGPFPVVIYFHGGGWLAGDKTLAERYADDLLARGLVLAAVNYRFSYQATFTALLYDCKGAVRWLRAHAGEYDIDPTRFAAFGESAGGHLASLVGTVSGDPTLEGNVGGNAAYSSHVQAVVHGYGPTDLFQLALFNDQRGSEISELIGHDIYDIIAHQSDPSYASWVSLVNSANPAQHAAIDDPPAYIIHGAIDDVVPASQSELLAEALDSAGAPETLRLMPGVGHEIPDSELPGLYAFLKEQLAPLPQILSANGLQDGESFGQSVAVLDDITGDGVDEIIVGAPLNDDKGTDVGRIVIVDGSSGALLRIIRGRAAGDQFGFALAACGDVNADGMPDFAVASPLADTPSGIDSGRVEVFAGGTWKRLRTLDGEHARDHMGHALASADVDGDLLRDIICGAPYADAPAVNSGCTLIFSSATGTLLKRIKGAAKNDRLGWAVAAAGDVDGDGRSDVIIGAPWNDGGGTNGGSVTVVGLSASQWVTRLTRTGAAGEQLGCAVAGLGDVNGDGLSDVAAGAPKALTSGTSAGVARLYSPAANLDLAILKPASPQPGENFGSAIAGTGDLDDDGVMDVLVGSPNRDLGGIDCGRISVFSGVGTLQRLFDGPAASSQFGCALAGRAAIVPGPPREVVVGAPGMFVNATRPGVAYILHADGSP